MMRCMTACVKPCSPPKTTRDEILAQTHHFYAKPQTPQFYIGASMHPFSRSIFSNSSQAPVPGGTDDNSPPRLSVQD